MTQPTCTICGKPSQDGYCCSACLGSIRRQLRGLPELLRELDTQVSRQSRHGQGAGGRSAERPSPFDLRASSVRDDLRTVLVGWTRVVCESEGGWPRDRLSAMAGRLAGHDWRRCESVDEFADELRWSLGQVRACIDLAPERVYLGPCTLTMGPERARAGQGATEGHGLALGANPAIPGAQSGVCRAEVWVRPGITQVTCRECGAVHDVASRQAALLAECADRLAHAELIGRALTSLSAPVDAATIRQWAHRKRLIAKQHDQLGRPLYRIGDVRELAQGMTRRGR